MYPNHLERDSKKFYRLEIKRFISDINRKVLLIAEQYQASIPILDSVESSQVSLDASDLAVELAKLEKEYGDFVPSDVFQNRITKNTKLIDAWSKAQTEKSFRNQNSKMGNPPPPGNSGGDRSGFRVPALGLPKESPKVFENINQKIKEQYNIMHSGMRDHMTDVQKIVLQGIEKGKSIQDIGKDLKSQNDLTAGRAEFWAEDQVQRFFAEQSELRQKEAGFPGFWWRNQKDSKVRETHRGKSAGGPADQYWYWDKPPILNRKGIGPMATKPGEEWRCRCYAEPDWPPINSKIESPKDPIQSVEIKSSSSNEISRKPSEIVKFSSQILSSRLGSTSRELNEILILPDSVKDVKVATILASYAKANPNTLGYFDPNTNSIGVSTLVSHQQLSQSTFVHEFAHMVDFNVLGKSEQYGTKTEKTKLFRETIVKTKTYKNLVQLLNKGEFLDGRKFKPDLATIKHIEYLLDISELFARANEQFLAKKLKSKKILSQIEIKKAYPISGYWEESELLMLEKTLEEIYTEAKILK
ncbi:MAG: hypothetical protein GW938_15555 [Leptospira sp.]|nr:hypothetical protein [Leptospira sp.]